MQIAVDADLRSLIPPLRPEELWGLEESIQAEGCRDPLVVWGSRNILLDGHNRIDICTRLGKPFQRTDLEFPDQDSAKLWIQENQLARRNLTDDQRAVIALRVMEQRSKIEKRDRAVKAREAVQSRNPVKKSDLSDTSSDKSETKADTRATVAQQAKVPERKLKDLAAIQKTVQATQGKAAAKKTLDSIANGQTTIREAKAEARKVERETKKQAELEQRAAIITPSTNGKAHLWEIRQGDCLDVLGSIEDESVRLIFADPPYNIGVDYGDHYDDAKPADEFDGFCQLWLAECLRKLTDDGSLWLLVNHEWARTLCLRAEDLGFHLRQWITWYESFGVNTTGMFNRCSRPLLWLVKDAGNFVFKEYVPEVRRPSDRQDKYQDSRANPDGKLWDDVWGVNPPIPRIVGTAKERVPGFPTQLPIALLRPIVACASDPGDLVADPFNGSGTTGAACIELGRRYVGIELSERFAGLSRTRLMAHEKEGAHAEA